MDSIAALDRSIAEFRSRLALVTEDHWFGTGSSGAVADDAPLQERYLNFIGRRP